MNQVKGLTIKHAAGLLANYGVQLLTKSGEDNRIENVTVREVVHSNHDLLLGGELVITNTGILQSNPDLLEDYHHNSIAALMVVYGDDSDLAVLNNALIARAEQLCLPIFIMPDRVPYAIITSTIYEAIFYDQPLSSLDDYSAIIKAFTNIFIAPDSHIGHVAQVLGNVITQNVVILDEHGRKLAFSPLDGEAAIPGSYIDSQAAREFFRSVRDQFSGQGEQMMRSRTEIRGQAYYQTLYKSLVHKRPVYFVLWSRDNLVKSDERVFQISILQAARAVAVLKARKKDQMLLLQKERDAFYNLVFHSSQSERESSLNMLAAQLNISPLGSFQIVVVDIYYESGGSAPEKAVKHLQQKMRQLFYSYQDRCIVFFEEHSVLILLHGIAATFPGLLENEVEPGIMDIVRETAKLYPHVQLLVGVGLAQKQMLGLRDSYKQAWDTITLGKRIRCPSVFMYYGGMGIYSLLGVETMPEFYMVCRAELEEMSARIGKNVDVILDTLETYYDNGMSSKQTAELLNVHINTIKYRIDKARDLLGEEALKNGEEVLRLHLLLKMRRLL